MRSAAKHQASGGFFAAFHLAAFVAFWPGCTASTEAGGSSPSGETPPSDDSHSDDSAMAEEAGGECAPGQIWLQNGKCGLAGPGCPDGLDTNSDGHCDRLVADWSRDARLPARGHRADIFGLGGALSNVQARGIEHALRWPVSVSGVMLPYGPMARLFSDDATDPTVIQWQDVTRMVLGFGTLGEMFDWIGLPRFDGAAEAQPGVPWPTWVGPGDSLGAAEVDTPTGTGLTFSCATCHAAQLFGRTVVGLTNRQAKANEFFHLAKSFFPALDPSLFASVTSADEKEVAMFVRSQEHFGAIEPKVPQAHGLDTSLAQVALSLSRRGNDPWATRDAALEVAPQPNALRDDVADSKPAVWWTLKYKTRWLADGSIVAGNPIFTNFLWNELGRGTDLPELKEWLEQNMVVVDELTAAAFATQPPRWENFFGVESIDEGAAQRGQAHFDSTCAGCHGNYDKGWGEPDAKDRSKKERIATVRVRYHEQTPVLNVGTSPNRAAGMAAFAVRLNDLAISKWMQTVVEVQSGYVPPPLEGIWARYPYFHNQSVPTLCDLLIPAQQRTAEFWIGPDQDPATDFDASCVGLPVGDAVPESWKEDSHRHYHTARPGLSNQGHDAWLTLPDGSPRFTAAERAELIEFLKTL